jgi:hypothetical protein
MSRTELVVAGVMVVSLFSGCYVEPGEGTAITFYGDFQVSEGEFTMNGSIGMTGGDPSQDEYEDLYLELYSENGTLLYEERIGTLRNLSDRIDVSVSLSTVPQYVILDSSDIWDGETGVDYWVRSKEAHQGYQQKTVTERGELPITPAE